MVSERHRHRYEFNPRFRSRFEGTDFVCSGTSPDGRLVEFIELEGHPFWVGTQAHPEFKSRPERPAPLVAEGKGWPRVLSFNDKPKVAHVRHKRLASADKDSDLAARLAEKKSKLHTASFDFSWIWR